MNNKNDTSKIIGWILTVVGAFLMLLGIISLPSGLVFVIPGIGGVFVGILFLKNQTPTQMNNISTEPIRVETPKPIVEPKPKIERKKT